MSIIDFNEVEVYNDDVTELEMLRKLVGMDEGENPLQMLNLGDILRKHQTWLEKMPRVVPHYAVKCNPNPTVIKLIAALGGNFDCATKEEMIQVMKFGVKSDRIIFANPMKFPCHIKHAKTVGVSLMTVDTEDELKTIKRIYPEAKILIRIRCDTSVTTAPLGKKYGCDPGDDALHLIHTTMAQGLELSGFSFHVGSPCEEASAICRGIKLCNDLIQTARSMGCMTARIIDIGGGFPGDRGFNLEEFSDPINAALKDVDPSIRIIAEPGRYYVTSAFTSTAYVIGKKLKMRGNEKTFMYYVSDGVFGSFISELLNVRTRYPFALNKATSECNTKYISTIWGPTCDSFDCMIKEELLPEFDIGDWLVWFNVGAYSRALSTEFNGFKPPKICPVMRKADWESMWMDINHEKTSH